MSKLIGQSVLSWLAAVLVLGVVPPVLGCMCPYVKGTLAEEISGEIERSSGVFTGKVTGFEYRKGVLYKVPGAPEVSSSEAEERETKLVRFEVTEWWKMAGGPEVFLISDVWRRPKPSEDVSAGNIVSLPVSDTSFGCGIPFVSGERYLVYASGPVESLQYRICSRTARLDKAADDLKMLGQGRKPAISSR